MIIDDGFLNEVNFEIGNLYIPVFTYLDAGTGKSAYFFCILNKMYLSSKCKFKPNATCCNQLATCPDYQISIYFNYCITKSGYSVYDSAFDNDMIAWTYFMCCVFNVSGF